MDTEIIKQYEQELEYRGILIERLKNRIAYLEQILRDTDYKYMFMDMEE